MSATSWSISEDLSSSAVALALTSAAIAIVALGFELRRRERLGVIIAVTGALGVAALILAVLRPVRVSVRGSVFGPRVVVLVDQSRRLLLPGQGGTRREVATRAVEALQQHFEGARVSVLGFGDGDAAPIREGAPATEESDLGDALESLAQSPGERPASVVVVSDGRVSRPAADADDASLERLARGVAAPIHAIAVADRPLDDATVRVIRAAGAAVAHQPLALTIEIACSGSVDCRRVPVTVEELRRNVPPALLASGIAEVDGTGTVQLTVTLDRAGPRILRVAIEAPSGDSVPENDERLVTFEVARERVRILHIAGRPTYDVRALRTWLKSDESIDLVAFFILRTDSDETETTSDDELALIPFPVDELFEDHLSSFDAVILQDIDALEYKFARHLGRLAQYVEAGGGLVLVGGPTAFAGGSYGDSALDRVLPIVVEVRGEEPFDTQDFVPRMTAVGRAAPMTRAVVELFGDALPPMPGSNTVGIAKKGTLVLWEHSVRKAGDGRMPVLALGEASDGRVVALTVDGTHRLAFSEGAAESGGRGHAALWDGLIGWIMRHPKYEAARVEIIGRCIAGQPTTARIHRLPGMSPEVVVTLEKLGRPSGDALEKAGRASSDGSMDLSLGALASGGYSARVRIGDAPPTRHDFACEAGGEALSDTRPDVPRLERITRIAGGVSVGASDVRSLPRPSPTEVAAERRVVPVAPAWAWSAAAALLLGLHWIARRRGGLV